MNLVIGAVGKFLPAFFSRKRNMEYKPKLRKEQVEDILSAATLHTLSRQTAQVSASSAEVVEDCNPHSLQTIVEMKAMHHKNF